MQEYLTFNSIIWVFEAWFNAISLVWQGEEDKEGGFEAQTLK